jgi:hypothetical protein
VEPQQHGFWFTGLYECLDVGHLLHLAIVTKTWYVFRISLTSKIGVGAFTKQLHEAPYACRPTALL